MSSLSLNLPSWSPRLSLPARLSPRSSTDSAQTQRFAPRFTTPRTSLNKSNTLPGRWRLEDFDLTTQPPMRLHVGSTFFDAGDGLGVRVQYDARSPEDQMRHLQRHEDAAYQHVLSREKLPPDTEDYPLATTEAGVQELLQKVRNGEVELWDSTAHGAHPAVSKGVKGPSKVQVASMPDSSDSAVWKDALLFCLEEGIGFGVVSEADWGAIWLRVWADRQMDAVDEGKTLLILTDDDGKISYDQTIGVSLLKAEGISYRCMTSKNFLRTGRPLIYAAWNKEDEMVRRLFANERVWLYLRHRKCDGQTPLHVWAARGHLHHISSAVLKGAEVGAKTFQGYTALHFACEGGHEAGIELLLRAKAAADTPARRGATPLFLGGMKGHAAAIRLLLAARADVDATTDSGTSTLSVAAQMGHEVAASRLLEARATVDLAKLEGGTPLFVASSKGHKGMVKLLLAAGARADLTEKNGASPLFMACQKGHEPTVKVLLEAQAQVDQAMSDGASPLFIASQNGHQATVQALLQGRAEVDLVEQHGASPLLMASQEGHKAVVKMLLAEGADANLVLDDGTGPLYVASRNGHEATMRQLLLARADVDLAAKDGATALHLACHHGHEAGVAALLRAGGRLEVEHRSGATPMSLARKAGHDSVVKRLLAARACCHI